MARLLALDVIGGRGLYEIECRDLNDYYDALKCDCFDITQRKIGGRVYDIYCDDEGTYVKDPIPSAFNSEHKPVLVGNLIFAKHDKEGGVVGLTDDDIQHIAKCAQVAKVRIHGTGDYPEQWTIIHPVDFNL